MTDQSSAKYGLSFRDGGWVLIGAAVLFLAILTWALAPAVLRMVARPPGDGETLASYEFDLSNLRLTASAHERSIWSKTIRSSVLRSVVKQGRIQSRPCTYTNSSTTNSVASLSS